MEDMPLLFCVSLLPPTVSMLLCSAGSSPEPLSSGSAQRSVWSQEGRASVTLATLSLRSRGALRSRQMASSEVDGGPNKVSDLKKWTKRNFPGGPVAKTQSYQCRGLTVLGSLCARSAGSVGAFLCRGLDSDRG